MAQKPDLIPSRGAISENLLLEVSRELSAEDLLRLGQAPKVSVPTLQRLRATHHRQAQLLAQGKSVNEVAAIVGCTVQRLVQLQVDPTFADLVTYYHDQIMSLALSDAARLHDKLVDVGEMAVDELRDRLDNEGKRNSMPVGEVRKIAEFAMDRTVAPPKAAPPQSTPPATVTINFGTPLRPVDDTKTIEHDATRALGPVPHDPASGALGYNAPAGAVTSRLAVDGSLGPNSSTNADANAKDKDKGEEGKE